MRMNVVTKMTMMSRFCIMLGGWLFVTWMIMSGLSGDVDVGGSVDGDGFRFRGIRGARAEEERMIAPSMAVFAGGVLSLSRPNHDICRVECDRLYREEAKCQLVFMGRGVVGMDKYVSCVGENERLWRICRGRCNRDGGMDFAWVGMLA